MNLKAKLKLYNDYNRGTYLVRNNHPYLPVSKKPYGKLVNVIPAPVLNLYHDSLGLNYPNYHPLVIHWKAINGSEWKNENWWIRIPIPPFNGKHLPGRVFLYKYNRAVFGQCSSGYGFIKDASTIEYRLRGDKSCHHRVCQHISTNPPVHIIKRYIAKSMFTVAVSSLSKYEQKNLESMIEQAVACRLKGFV